METQKSSGKAASLIIGLAMGVLMTAVIAGCLVMINSKKNVKIEGKGYDSPEEAVEAYVNFIKEGNIDGAISTFAVESYLDHYDYSEHYDYYQTFFPFLMSGGLMGCGIYSDSPIADDLNIENRRSYIINSIHRHIVSIMVMNSDEEEVAEAVRDGIIVNIDKSGSAKDIMNFLSTDPELESIEIGKFLDKDDFEVNEDSVERAVKSLEKIWDSDVQPVMVELEIAGEDYTLFMLCVNYDGKWYNADFNNTIALSLGVGSTSKGLVPNEELPD